MRRSIAREGSRPWYCYHCGAELDGNALPCEKCQSWVAASWPNPLPATEAMPPRPVHARYLRRQRNPLSIEPPSEFEKADAIRVLEDPLNAEIMSFMWHEAFAIFEEAGL